MTGRHFTSMEKEAKNGNTLTTEDCLWGVPIVLLLVQRSPVSWVLSLTVFQYMMEVAMIFYRKRGQFTQSSKWRKGGDDGGLMQVALLACLFHACKITDHYHNLAKLVTFVSSTNETFACISFMVGIWLDQSLCTVHSVVFALTWLCLTALSRAYHGSLTKGESAVIVALSTILISETAIQIKCFASCSDISHELVSILGGAGCLATCIVLGVWSFPWWIRLQLHLVGPLAIIETGLAWREYSPLFNDYVPRCLDWLVSFLVSPEGGYPRYATHFPSSKQIVQ